MIKEASESGAAEKEGRRERGEGTRGQTERRGRGEFLEHANRTEGGRGGSLGKKINSNSSPGVGVAEAGQPGTLTRKE